MFAEHPHSPLGVAAVPVLGAAPPARPVADPAAPDAVAAALLDDLGGRLGVRGLAYAEPLTPVPDGWESYIYTFRLRGPWERPLLLRIHANRHGLPRARHEFEVPRRLAELGYPVPEAVLLEESCDLFGGPYLITERVCGPTMLQAMMARFWNPLHHPARMAEAHARLHALPTENFPAPAGPFLERHFAEMRAVVLRHNLAGLTPGLDWLEAHQPPPPATPSILHLDFHPLNLIERPDGTLVVIDWTYADLGDPHADVATTLLIVECAPAGEGLWERLQVLVGRPILTGWYLHVYRGLRRLDERRLAYFRAWSALRRLVRYARWLRAGPEVSGCKPDLVEHLDPDFLGALRRYFRRWSGVDVHL
jgi:aminoglycoside phosphotransferase (APT) family kinase protein